MGKKKHDLKYAYNLINICDLHLEICYLLIYISTRVYTSTLTDWIFN